MKRNDLAGKGTYVLAAILMLLWGVTTSAVAQEVLSTDLAPLIDQSAQFPTRFAVDVPHTVSTANAGTWTQSGTRSTWTYSIRIPTAVSMSFHASGLSLPGDAELTVTGKNGAGVSYKARDIVRGGLWSRLFPGDSLALSLSVSASERPAAAVQIASFQAGYRSLGGTVQDNPHYLTLRNKSAQPSSCMVNYSCQATSANQGPAHATVAIVVGNVTQCTGTLVNDTSSDGVPYVLTARHCENGELGGGDPAAAASVSVYWDAVTPCGSTLGMIYSTDVTTQSGATTVVEQQDAWLIKLDSPPAAADAYYSGWDATGGTFSGGYSIHHALGYNKQYVGWYGQPILQTISGATLDIGYSSTFWGLVNETGSVGAGASGSALFDPNNHLVGSATLAELVDGEGSAGVCPATPPPTPSPSTVTASYTALSSVWNSTADTTSGTGAATLKSLLDPTNTGNLVSGGFGKLAVTLTATPVDPQVTQIETGQMLNLTWNAPGAQSCTASGGSSGDGWAGTQVASGTFTLTENTGGATTYSILCTAGDLVGSATVTVNWQVPPLSVSLGGSGPTAAAGRMVLLQWNSLNVQSCTASGGTSGDGWAGTKATSGSQSVQASMLGNVTYTITCVLGTRTVSSQYSITVVAPSVGQISGDANQMLPGQTVNLQFTGGGACVASGGAAGDGWAGPLSTSSQDSGVLGYTLPVTETAAGTYTYTVTCSGAGATASLSSSNSITLTFTGSQPTASLSASPTPVEIYTDSGATASVLNLAWTSNVRPCSIASVGPGNQTSTVIGLNMSAPVGTASDDQEVAGSYVYTLTCGTGQYQAQSSTPAVWFTNTPTVTLNVTNPWPQNSPATVSWQSNVYPCTGTGGVAGDGWAGAKAKAMAYQSVTESTLGAVTFGITCGTGSQIAQAQATSTVITPSVSITASANTLAVNGILDIRWNANVGPCSSSISPGTGNFGTVLSTSGGFQTTQLVAGTDTYTINCAGVQASTAVTFTGSLTTLTANMTNVSVGTPVALSWSAPSYTTSCTASGGSPGDGWAGSLGNAGTKNVTSASASTVTYSIACDFGYGPSQAQTQVTYTPVSASEPAVPVPTATLTASAPNVVVGSSVTLSWTSENANACMAIGGDSGDGWSGNLSLSGSMKVTEPGQGDFNYGIVCTGAPPAGAAYTDVNFTNAAVTVTGSSSSGGKSGGGGAFDLWGISLLGLVMSRQLSARLKHPAPRIG
jgi:hypothetical protein